MLPVNRSKAVNHSGHAALPSLGFCGFGGFAHIEEGFPMTKRNVLGLVLGLAIAGPALASGVYFSQYIEGSGSNKAVELYNGSGATISMADFVFSMASNGANTPFSNRVAFSGTLGYGCTFVVSNSGANAAILAEADATSNSFCNWNGDDCVSLYQIVAGDTILVDRIGTLGNDPGTSWNVYDPTGTVVEGQTHDKTLYRRATVVDGNPVWAGSCDREWDVMPINTYDGFGSHGSIPCSGNINPSVDSVTLNPAAPTEDDPVEVSAEITDADGTVITAELHWGFANNALGNVIAMQNMGGNTWETMVPIPDNNACTTVYYQVVATDNAAGVGQSLVASYTVECVRTIAQIQGAGANSPYDGASVCTQGTVQRVVADRFFIQEGTGPRQGITVFTGSAPTVAVGDQVEVCGMVDEFFGLTEFTGSPAVSVISTGNPVYLPVVLDAATASTEDYESMLVTVGPLHVTAVQNNFGEFTLADVSGTIWADVDHFVIDPAPELDDCYTLTGIQYYSFSKYTVFPTEAGPMW
jgi:predicted extracellular nuclease